MTLDNVRVGQACIVQNVIETGALSQRLLEMGFVHGTRVQVVRLAPLGDPMEVRLMGFLLSLRKEDARHIEVELCPSS